MYNRSSLRLLFALFAIFCRYNLGEFKRILRHFEAVTRVDCYLVSVYKGVFVDICQFKPLG